MHSESFFSTCAYLWPSNASMHSLFTALSFVNPEILHVPQETVFLTFYQLHENAAVPLLSEPTPPPAQELLLP